MSWVEAKDYRAIIGGCYFHNVPRIAEHNGQPLITVKRNILNNRFGVDTNILDRNGALIGEIRNDEISIGNRDTYQILSSENRLSIVEVKTGRIIYDITIPSNRKGVDFELSLTTYLPNGLPVFFHPNRIRIGSPRILKPHITSLKLETKYGAQGPALIIELQYSDKNEKYLYVPAAPMTGAEGLVTKCLSLKEGQQDSGMTTLMMYGENNQATNISLRGPCYFLDMAFKNFETAISINRVSKK